MIGKRKVNGEVLGLVTNECFLFFLQFCSYIQFYFGSLLSYLVVFCIVLVQ